jgi:hypothetical protein
MSQLSVLLVRLYWLSFKEIVAYCRGPFCFFSHEAVLRLKKKGFNARRLNCGLPDWRFAGLPIEVMQ